jgi:hypothetical protein
VSTHWIAKKPIINNSLFCFLLYVVDHYETRIQQYIMAKTALANKTATRPPKGGPDKNSGAMEGNKGKRRNVCVCLSKFSCWFRIDRVSQHRPKLQILAGKRKHATTASASEVLADRTIGPAKKPKKEKASQNDGEHIQGKKMSLVLSCCRSPSWSGAGLGGQGTFVKLLCCLL